MTHPSDPSETKKHEQTVGACMWVFGGGGGRLCLPCLPLPLDEVLAALLLLLLVLALLEPLARLEFARRALRLNDEPFVPARCKEPTAPARLGAQLDADPAFGGMF